MSNAQRQRRKSISVLVSSSDAQGGDTMKDVRCISQGYWFESSRRSKTAGQRLAKITAVDQDMTLT